MQRETQEESTIDANVFLPPELNDISNNIKSSTNYEYSPAYGCLKNGSKPTWREWKRNTQKVYDEQNPLPKQMPKQMPIQMPKQMPKQMPTTITHENSIPPAIQSMKPPLSFNFNDSQNNPIVNKPVSIEITERELKLQSLRRKMKQDELTEKRKKNKIKETSTSSTLKKRTTKVQNHYGKQNNKVSVLIKNSTTRKNIQKEHNLIKQSSIEDVKKYLKKQYLLKIGSNAPNDVLRKMYETVHLCGEVKNINSENLVHNYLNDEPE